MLSTFCQLRCAPDQGTVRSSERSAMCVSFSGPAAHICACTLLGWQPLMFGLSPLLLPGTLLLLCCCPAGVLPPVSKLTLEQAMYHFIR